MKIKLINPAQLDASGQPLKLNKEVSAGLTLPYIAALMEEALDTPADISVVEESMTSIDFDEPVDLVGLTAITCRAPRAYWIAEQYRAKGVPVIMGGFHATALPDEALRHCDAVVKGEAEDIIRQLLDDARAGRLSGIYESNTPHDLTALPVPRYDLININHFFLPAYPVQVTRGCPYRCDFCSVTSLFGSFHRKRPIADVLRDMRAAGPYLNIVDDNLTANRQYALDLFKAMKPLKKFWFGQIDMRAAADGELMQAAADSGCRALYLGIETLDTESLLQSKKVPNLNISAREALMQLKRCHIDAFASMIIGFDTDTEETAAEIIDFCNRLRVPVLFLYILTPAPGSPIYQRLQENGTRLKKDWHLYDGTHSVYDTPMLTSTELESLYMSIQKNVYSLSSIIKRTFFPPHVLMLFMNLYARRNVKNDLHPWMGNNRWEKVLTFMQAVGEPLSGPTIRKISKLIRFAEGRLIP